MSAKKDTHRLFEEDIRPTELMKKKESCLLWDRNFLVERKEQFVRVNCPACDSRQSEQLFIKDEMRYISCEECETVYINPRPPENILHEFYEKSKNYDFWNKYIFPQSEERRRQSIFKPRVQKTLEYVRRYLPDSQSIMEVGAGFGIFCEELKKVNRFSRVIAVEPTPGLAETCRKKAIETLELPVEKLPAHIKVDVIASFEVIEHLFSPREFLESCERHLSSQGLLILSCPNVKGFDMVNLGKKSDTFGYEHLNYFHPESLSYLLKTLGFKILEVETPGVLDAELVRKGVLSGKINLDNNLFLRNILLDNWDTLGEGFQDFLIATNQSSHMMIIAKKQND